MWTANERLYIEGEKVPVWGGGFATYVAAEKAAEGRRFVYEIRCSDNTISRIVWQKGKRVSLTNGLKA